MVLSKGTLNFSEAGHGKGLMDGVGAVIKHTADRIVGQGENISGLASLLHHLEKNITHVKIALVTEDYITNIDKLLPQKIEAVPNLTKVHQITWDAKETNRAHLKKSTCICCNISQKITHYSLPKSYVNFNTLFNEQDKNDLPLTSY